ncbi:MAG: Nif3-like dinuclear metal center hexameric protein [Armatimonadota bacterium]
MPSVGEVIEVLELIAPPWMADDGDAIGLQVGDRSPQVRRIRTAVDPTREVVDAALDQQADLLVTHHPLIRSPLRSLAAGDPVADRALRLATGECALYVLHTNYDTAPGGVNDVLAEKLGLRECVPLTAKRQDRYHKVVVFVPDEAVEQVRNAMAEAGAGRIGLYSHCSFRVRGTGSFLPGGAAKPHVGAPGRLEEVDEWRLEMICTGAVLDGVLRAMRENHPYEEVAYDVYELANEPVRLGYGRIGSLAEPATLSDFAQHVRDMLNVRFLRLFGDPSRQVRTVAVCSGGGASLYREAAGAGADVYVTGDWKHHDILNAADLGLTVIDAGHFETERPGMAALAERLAAECGPNVDVKYVE